MAEALHERIKSLISTEELERRIEEICKLMKREKIDCIFANSTTRNFGGYNRWMTDTLAETSYPQTSVITADGEISYITSGSNDSVYPAPAFLRVGKSSPSVPFFSVFNYTNSWEGRIGVRLMKEKKAKKIGIAGMHMFYWNFYEFIAENAPEVEIVDAMPLLDELRTKKSPEEIKNLYKSAEVQDKVMGFLSAFCLPGVREYEIRSQAMRFVSDLGGEGSIIQMGSAPRGEIFRLWPSYFQNRTLGKGDVLYIKLCSSGPNGMYTTLGRTFSIGCEPTAQMEAQCKAVLQAEEKLVSLLQIGAEPQVVLSTYNTYLESIGCIKESGIFAHGQGYDHIERPSIQIGETMLLSQDMCLALNISLLDGIQSAYCADSFLLKAGGPERLHKSPKAIFRT